MASFWRFFLCFFFRGYGHGLKRTGLAWVWVWVVDSYDNNKLEVATNLFIAYITVHFCFLFRSLSPQIGFCVGGLV